MITIGVLAVQGAFIEHEHRMEQLGARTVELRCAEDLNQPLDGLILPGGESTAMGKLLRELGMLDTLREKIRAGLPVFGTCAGLILLAKGVEGENFNRISTMDINVRRNAYGRQLGSFFTTAPMRGVGDAVPMTFIRAPYINSVGEGVDILAQVDGHIVAARQANQLVTSFHPELNDPTAVHAFFLSMIAQS